MYFTRRSMLQAAAAAGLASWPFARVIAAEAGAATIAYQVDVPSWDPIAHTSPPAMPIFKSVFDQPLIFTPDLKLAPSVMKEWKLHPDGLAIDVTFRDDVLFHNGDKLTAEDFRFSFLERQQADPKLATAAVWRRIKDIEVTSPTAAIVHLSAPMPTAPQWWGFMGSFILPRKYFTEIGKEKFLDKPVGSGPFRLAEYVRDSRIVLEANKTYWGGVPKLARVTIAIVKDPTARTAAVESGQADVASQLSIRETVRLGTTQGLKSLASPITDLIILQVANMGAFTDANVRLAAHHAIDKQAISKAFFNDIAKPLSVLAVPGTPGYVEGFTFPYSPEKASEYLKKSGFGPTNPAKIHFNTTNGTFPNDFEMARAIVAMWQKVGIAAELEVIELNKYFELNHSGKMPEATLYRWGNETGDPEIYTGYILNPKLPFSTWKSEDVGAILDKLFAETDYDKRIKGYQELNTMVVEKGYAMPLLQGVSTVAYRNDVSFTPYANGWVLPATLART
jgi:peptide/nickel transport system substrate-binding protein